MQARAAPVRAIVGRQAELAAIGRFLEHLSDRASEPTRAPGALLIEGPPGIGKTALWLAAIDLAHSAGVRVLRARPAEAEAAYAYAALGDLLRDVLPEVLPRLPVLQRRTIELALGQGGETTAPVDPQLVQGAAANALLALAAQGPLLIAIDDAPWMDAPSAAAVQFFARRAGGRRAGLIVAQRADEQAPAPLGLDEAFAEGPAERLWLGPLSLAALHLLLVERLQLTLPRPVLVRLHELSGGLPYHALEIGRALQGGPLPATGAPLPIPPSLRELLGARILGVEPTVRELLLLVAAGGTISFASAEMLLGGEPAQSALAIALDEAMLTIEEGHLRATHPLVASIAYGLASSAARRRAHGRLAGIVNDQEYRARHRALASLAPDEDVAGDLEAAARRARGRGAPDTAAELLRLARERTPPFQRAARDRRLLALAQALAASDDLPAAGRVIDELLAAEPEAAIRAEAGILRAEVAWYTATSPAAVAHLQAALTAAAGNSDLEAEIEWRLGLFIDFDLPRALTHARRAVELVEGSDRPSLLSSALMQVFYTEVLLGLPPRVDLLERALAVEPRPNPTASTIPGIWWLALDRHADARRRFQSMLDDDRLAGQLSSEADLLTRLAEVELFADNYAVAGELADAATAAARQHGSESADPARRARALIDAHVGLLGDAEAIARPAAEHSVAAGDPILAAAWLVVLGFVAASRGDPEAVLRISDESRQHFSTMGIQEPLRLDLAHERLEALVGVGRLDEAGALVAQLEQRNVRIPRPSLSAAIVRGRTLLHLARGEVDEAVRASEAALGSETGSWRRFDRARTLLVRGTALRRARALREAGAALDQAIELFEELGAVAWLERSRTEAERLGRRRLGGDALTPAELQVARLASSGLTNREVADRLSLSPKTVEAHLARAYAKLGIGSRAELGRVMAGQPTE